MFVVIFIIKFFIRMQNKTIFLALVTIYLGSVSCGKNNADVDPAYCSRVWTTEVQDELNALITAGTAWSSNQTTANCNAYKAAYSAYIKALEPFGNCSGWTGQTREAWRNALDEARAELNNLCD
jgi:hypothetical protein